MLKLFRLARIVRGLGCHKGHIGKTKQKTAKEHRFSRFEIILYDVNYSLKRLTFNAVRPLGPLPISKLTILFSFIGTLRLLA